MELGLKGRAAIVTGASRGIGKAIARGLAAEGVNVVAMARGSEALEHSVEEIERDYGVRALAVPADVRDAEAVRAAAAAAVAELGTIHIVVNNAGSGIRRMDRQINWPDTEWIDDVNVKLIGMLRVTQAFLPSMARDGSGRVINISGIAGVSAFLGALTHGLNNSAMNHATSYLARDLASERITVNAVIPGLIATEWREEWAENMGKQQGQTKEEFLEHICRQWGIVSGRWGTMAELADLVVFLASDRAAYINGARIAFDGGFAINPR